MKGKVYLVGAGPGDGKLLTLKGYELLQKADVVVYDRLVSAEIMEMIPEETRLINVGKNVGDHPVPQWRINEILLEEALEGNLVVRLKGGDPFIFGRGGEELELLAENNVDFAVVPGITSSISAPAYGGIPATHRDFCSSLHIITGHGKKDTKVDLDFESLVKLNGTLIFMMSVATSPYIAKGLIEAGMEGSMPCAIIENGTRPEQRTFVGTIENLENLIKDNNVKSPAVIMVGKVCSLSNEFSWFDKLPLKNKKILVTQPEKKASTLDEGLIELGAETFLYPCIKTKFIRQIEPDIDWATALLFTSTEGVKSFFEDFFSKGKDARHLKDKKFLVVGKATARALKSYGVIADFIPSVYTGEDLAIESIEKGIITKDDKVLMLRAKVAAESVSNIYKEHNIDFIDYPVYETSYIDHKPLENLKDYDYITFTSKSCVEGFVKSQENCDFSTTKAVAIGEITKKVAVEYGFKVIMAKEASIESMIEVILGDVKNDK